MPPEAFTNQRLPDSGEPVSCFAGTELAECNKRASTYEVADGLDFAFSQLFELFGGHHINGLAYPWPIPNPRWRTISRVVLSCANRPRRDGRE
jgi:hypothetical protein